MNANEKDTAQDVGCVPVEFLYLESLIAYRLGQANEPLLLRNEK